MRDVRKLATCRRLLALVVATCFPICDEIALWVIARPGVGNLVNRLWPNKRLVLDADAIAVRSEQSRFDRYVYVCIVLWD